MLRIVAVEDNQADTDLLEEALRLSAKEFSLTRFEDAESAAKYLSNERACEAQLIILDLKLPGRSGLELLREIKADTEMRKIPVIVVTASEDPRDVSSAYELHASCYLVKRRSVAEQLKALIALLEFWLGTASLPWQQSSM
jgi:two-component system, chemotaxis family, response regulator Rcp1